MNDKQLIVLWVTITITAFMVIFPPITATVSTVNSGKTTFSSGVEYGFAFSRHLSRIQLGRLAIQLFIVLIIFVGLMAITSDNRKMTKVMEGSIN